MCVMYMFSFWGWVWACVGLYRVCIYIYIRVCICIYIYMCVYFFVTPMSDIGHAPLGEALRMMWPKAECESEIPG